MVFGTKSTFRVFPEKWDEICDRDIVSMYRSFREWLFLNEESMTVSEADKAWKMVSRWEGYLKRRGLAFCI